jgi:hypothetical protein
MKTRRAEEKFGRRSKELHSRGSEVELSKHAGLEKRKCAADAEFRLEGAGLVIGSGKRALLPTGLFGASEKHLFEHANRIWPVYFTYPFETVDDITVTLPDGWKVDNQPKDMDRDAKAVEFKLEVKTTAALCGSRATAFGRSDGGARKTIPSCETSISW